MIYWALGVAAVAVLLLLGSLRSVNMNERGVIYTLGRYSRTTGPGIALLLPLVQTIRCVDVAPRNAGRELDDVATADGERVRVAVFATYQVADPRQYAANLSGPRDNAYSKSVVELAVVKLLERSARERVLELPLGELQAGVERVASELESTLGEAVGRWGIQVVRLDMYFEPAPGTEGVATYRFG